MFTGKEAIVFAVGLACCAWIIPAAAHAGEVRDCGGVALRTDLPTPLTSSPVTLNVGAECPDTCFEVCDVVLEQVGPKEFHIDWYVRDLGMSGIACFAVLTPVISRVELGLLDANLFYTATASAFATDWDTPCRDARFVDDKVLLFSVHSDCNANGVTDFADIVLGTSTDCDHNGIPDECQPDCNNNGVADACDITDGTSSDCDGNGVPDECDPDCNENGTSDVCDLLEGTSRDCDSNGVPDECDPDCNGNHVPDACDIRDGRSEDENGNGIPDECEPEIPAVSAWGLLATTLILLATAKICFGRRSRPRPGRRSETTSMCLVLVTLLLGMPARAQGPNLEVPHRPDRLLVRFKPDASLADRRQLHDSLAAGEVREYFHVPGLVYVSVPQQSLEQALDVYINSELVLYAQPDYFVEFSRVPNDPDFPKQWAARNTGQYANGDQGFVRSDFRGVQAWDEWIGAQTIRIAVIDTGVMYDHPDFFNDTNGNGQLDSGEPYNIWVNPCEDLNHNGIVDGTDRCSEDPPVPNGDFNCVDDACDGEQPNGYVDDIVGYDFCESIPGSEDCSEDPDPRPSGNPHGTWVAGVIGALGDNGLGVAGVNWTCYLVPLKIQSIENAISAMGYVIANGIEISNNSYSGGPDNPALRDAIQAAGEQIGHIFVAAAGNDGLNIDVHPRYPAASDLPNVVTAAATGTTDGLPVFSNYGSTSVDLGAPGTQIYTTTGTDSYAYVSGTSFASPEVAGVAALVWTRFPSLDPDPIVHSQEVIQQILMTVRPVPSLQGKTVTGGVLNAFAAVADLDQDGTPDAQQIAADPTLDCNGNGNWILDAFEPDCDMNGVADSCEIAKGTAADCNGDGVPNQCQTCAMVPAGPRAEDTGPCATNRDCRVDPLDTSEPVFCLRDSCYTTKNRYLSFVPPTPCDALSPSMAFRVTFLDLPRPHDVNNGTVMWVGAPQVYCENSGQVAPPCGPAPGVDPTFGGATLQCTPHYTDWTSLGTIHVFHEEIVPDAMYEITAIAQGCDGDDENSYSAPLTLVTGKWGDVVRDCTTCPCTAPQGVANITDVSALVDKFQNLNCAPIKARCDLVGIPPTDAEVDQIVSILDVTACLQGFQGLPYPFAPAPDPPCP